MGDLAGQQSLFGQHDHAMQRGPDFQRAALAQKSDGRGFQRFQQQANVSIAAPWSSLSFGAQAMMREANIRR